MGSVYDFYSARKLNFEVRNLGDYLGYYFFRPTAITINGKISQLGYSFSREIVLVSLDDEEIIGTRELEFEENEDEFYFIENSKKWCELLKVDERAAQYVGLPSEEFYEKIKELKEQD